MINNYKEYESKYNNILNFINEHIYIILMKLLNKLEISGDEILEIKELYSKAEVNYIHFMNYLKKNNKRIYEVIPHGTEDLNVW